jgi:uncharacterized membrane protein
VINKFDCSFFRMLLIQQNVIKYKKVMHNLFRKRGVIMDEQNQQQSQAPQAAPAPQGGDKADAEKNKAMAIVGYIIPLLFFVPLISDAKNSPFAKFHANQQLNLLLAAIVVNIVGTMIPIIGWFIILPIGTIIVIVLAIIGIINGAKGEKKPLPIIGGFSLIK